MIEDYLAQTMEMPIIFPITCFIMGCLFYFVLDGVSGIMHCLITKVIQKIKNKKENIDKNV